MQHLVRTTATIVCVLLLPFASSLAVAQDAPAPAPAQLLGPDQLDDLVAPIALYPDPLLSQMLAASTYPLEIVEAQQWRQQNGNLQDQALIAAARQQNWDSSVQALLAFPDAMALFSRDVRWTTDLGNTFLAQQADVMDAIQRLRARASDNGRLATTPQQVVSTETQDQRSAIQIQPADPQVVYPPVYNPADVWGPPVAGNYPALSYPQSQYESNYDSSSGYGFGSGINVGQLLSGVVGGLTGGFAGGFGGWGWVLDWFAHALFFGGSGSQGPAGGFYGAGGFSAPAVWAHNPVHRLGVPYSNGFLSARYRAPSFAPTHYAPSARAAAAIRPMSVSRPASSNGWRSLGGSAPASAPRVQRAPAYQSGYASNRGAALPNQRNYATAKPQQMSSSFRSSAQEKRFSAPRAASQHFSKPRASKPHFSAPRHSGGGPSRSSKGSHKSSRKH